ncbi:hypothetical protein DB29_02567 [Shouchella clausii]|nr:hypothetical protein DB29_02567 [Shouchella clausii]
MRKQKSRSEIDAEKDHLLFCFVVSPTFSIQIFKPAFF